MPAHLLFVKKKIYFFKTPKDKEVFRASVDPKDVDAFYVSVERRANAVAHKLKATLIGVDSKSGGVQISLNEDKLLLSNEWVNHLLSL